MTGVPVNQVMLHGVNHHQIPGQLLDLDLGSCLGGSSLFRAWITPRGLWQVVPLTGVCVGGPVPATITQFR